MSQCHASDSVFCHRHRLKVGLLDLVEEAWIVDALPDDEMVLPEGHQISMDEAEEKGPDLEAKGEEKWSELPLASFLEEEAEGGLG
mmetsp:Transcript_110387/g.351925  ORF Transcript_110387/g.351925 Transcript_110387/m.351925 type:complete len:86 (+) Transcript_110387:62-319(+)|eukprot:CAMPEP_0203867722 /NCGR_PEP_ID=MMETSP0359-20131031/16693_1 /ASSEMBLY_ACC=CAM_ASM_000338 /TAXON_ID=268821 /ORGANISM="Scrippsiella Hangoei, Strain SHTV-5" /LENGTH=85 /DNA_ID=CAMNT_0050786017 /DNA_START=62 /DNA_END=319 /DNA_ORIENTATION=+